MAGQRARGFKITETDAPAQDSNSSQNRQTGKESGERVVAAAEVQKRRREASGTPSDSERMDTIQAQLQKRQRRELPQTAGTSSRRQQFEEGFSLFGPRDQIDKQIADGMTMFDKQAREAKEVKLKDISTSKLTSLRGIEKMAKHDGRPNRYESAVILDDYVGRMKTDQIQIYTPEQALIALEDIKDFLKTSVHADASTRASFKNHLASLEL